MPEPTGGQAGRWRKTRQAKGEGILEIVTIDKLVHGGQGLGVLPDGRKIFVWNALPGETVVVKVLKGKRDYAEGITVEIITASLERTEPLDEAYLSTSPWQIMTFQAENKYKSQILTEAFTREKLNIPKIDFISGGPTENPLGVFHYRNKMEYSFWADEDGLHLALFNRGSHGKRIIKGSSLARPEIDQTATAICKALNDKNIRGSQLKTIVVRCDQSGSTVAAIFVKDQDFPVIKELQQVCQGLTVCFSNPKSPASILTKELYTYGDITLTDKVLGTDITYDVHSFFQVNVPIFELAAARIAEFTLGVVPKVDFYSGVGTIGLPAQARVLVDSDQRNILMARKNVAHHRVEVVEATAETALDYIPPGGALIVDPPRAGLHSKVIDKIIEVRPNIIAYLSCNPSTQARDLRLLSDVYEILGIEGYNFFPRTPHIESLSLLRVK